MVIPPNDRGFSGVELSLEEWPFIVDAFFRWHIADGEVQGGAKPLFGDKADYLQLYR